MRTVTFRLKPGTDLKQSIEAMVAERSICAGFVLTCVGSLQQAVVRMSGAKPDAQDVRTYTGSYEVVSLVGTVSTSGCHLHMSFSDNEGVVLGGHLKEGTIIHTTAEVVVGIEDKTEYRRELDDDTGFAELVVVNQ
jgi:uncharacterized protein